MMKHVIKTRFRKKRKVIRFVNFSAFGLRKVCPTVLQRLTYVAVGLFQLAEFGRRIYLIALGVDFAEGALCPQINLTLIALFGR